MIGEDPKCSDSTSTNPPKTSLRQLLCHTLDNIRTSNHLWKPRLHLSTSLFWNKSPATTHLLTTLARPSAPLCLPPTSLLPSFYLPRTSPLHPPPPPNLKKSPKSHLKNHWITFPLLYLSPQNILRKIKCVQKIIFNFQK